MITRESWVQSGDGVGVLSSNRSSRSRSSIVITGGSSGRNLHILFFLPSPRHSTPLRPGMSGGRALSLDRAHDTSPTFFLTFSLFPRPQTPLSYVQLFTAPQRRVYLPPSISPAATSLAFSASHSVSSPYPVNVFLGPAGTTHLRISNPELGLYVLGTYSDRSAGSGARRRRPARSGSAAR
jgi:hypothetical protein